MNDLNFFKFLKMIKQSRIFNLVRLIDSQLFLRPLPGLDDLADLARVDLRLDLALVSVCTRFRLLMQLQMQHGQHPQLKCKSKLIK